jgi:hypothetical protein
VNFDSFLSRFPGARKQGRQWQAKCPAHQDQKPSLSISEGKDGRILVKCQAGCGTESVCAALGLTTADLFVEQPTAAPTQRRIVATYDYFDERDRLLFQAVRYEPKRFSQRRPDSHGNWIWGLSADEYAQSQNGDWYKMSEKTSPKAPRRQFGDCPRVLYRLRELLATGQNETVFITEGEKDVERLRSLGLAATCNPMGAGKWRDEYNEPLRGRPLVVIEDNDKAGREHAAQVARSLQGVAASIKVLRLPGLPEKGDVSDWLDAGGTVERLLELVGQCAEWAPDNEEAKPKAPKAPKEAESAEGKPEKRTQADVLIEVASAADFFFCVEEDEAYVSVLITDSKGQNGAHQETYRVNSKPFRQFLSRAYWLAEGKIPNNEALQNAVSHLAGQARFEGEQRPVFLRLASHEGRIYWDLCNRAWQILEISDTGWRVIEAHDAPVRFRRTRGMLPLPLPVAGGKLETLQQFVNYPDAAAWALHAAWLVAALRANGRTFPVLIVNGEQGSAKSTACKITRRLIDPNTADLRPKPREDRDLYIAANNSWVCGFDNLSGLSRDLSDSICRIATGAGFGGRELFSDADETLFQVARPVMLNGIDDLADKADLIDRGVFIELPPIPEEERKDEDSLWTAFDAAQPALIGALADALVVALRELPKVKLDKLPRMADFAKWGVAAGIGGKDTFINAYTGNRVKANQDALRANDIADCLIEWYSEEEPVTTDLTKLLTQLTALCRERLASKLGGDPKRVKLPDGWPSTERKLSNELRRCAPNLRRAGIEVLDGGLDPDTRKARRTFRRIELTPTEGIFNPSEASEASGFVEPTESKRDISEGLPEGLGRRIEGNPSETPEASTSRRIEGQSFGQSFGESFDSNRFENQQIAETAKLSKLPKLSKQPQSESVWRKVVRI